MGEIRYIFADIDGVLTDGCVQINEDGHERKSICYRDLDAIGVGHGAGIKFIFVTGENTAMASRIVRRFKADDAILGAKDKEKAFDELVKKLGVSPSEVCYVGDSHRDIPAIQKAGLGAAPADAAPKVKKVADIVLQCAGGKGVLMELVERIIDEEKGE